MRLRYLLPSLTIAATLAGSALGYTYTVYREDIDKVIFHSYDTIIPTDSPLRNSAPQGACNGGFSPNPCVGTIPEPGTWALIGLGLALMMFRRGRA